MKNFLVLFVLSISCFFIYSANVSAKSINGTATYGYSVLLYGSGQSTNVTMNQEPGVPWTKFISSKSDLPIISPFTIEIAFNSPITDTSYKYFYITGYANFSVQNVFGASCENMANSSSNYQGRSNEENQLQSLIPFAFKCSNTGASTYWYRFGGTALLRNTISWQPVIYFYNGITYTDEGSVASVEDLLDKQIKQQEETNKNIKETNDTLKDDKTDEAKNSANSFFDGFESDDFGLSDIVTMPLTFIQGLANSTCNSLNLPMPFVNQNVELPCMTQIYEEYFGSFLTIYQIITTGIISYWVCINVFKLVQGFKNPDKDDIEVMDL